MDAQPLNIWETYPAVLDIPSLRADPYLTRLGFHDKVTGDQLQTPERGSPDRARRVR